MWKDTIRKSKEFVTASKKDDAVTGNISGEGVMSIHFVKETCNSNIK